MDFVQVVVLALIQGLTEFLPVSSSAHLILAPQLLGWADQGQAFDVAVHVGTLAAVIGYFHRDLRTMARDWFRSLAARKPVGASPLAWAVAFGTFPAALVGLVFCRSDRALSSLATGNLRGHYRIWSFAVCGGPLLQRPAQHR